MIIAEEYLNQVINKAIPIYTLRNPHPVKKRPDCPLERDYKRRLREEMKARAVLIIKEYHEKSNKL